MSRQVDARGLRCPWPALRAAAAMRDSPDVTVLTDDPAATDEIARLAAARGWCFSAEGTGIVHLALTRDNESLSGSALR